MWADVLHYTALYSCNIIHLQQNIKQNSAHWPIFDIAHSIFFNHFAFFFVVMYWWHLMTRWELAVFYGNNMFKVHAGKWKCGTQHNSQGYRFLEFISCADGTSAYFHVFIRYLFQSKWGEKGEKAQKQFCVLLLFGFVLMLCHGKFLFANPEYNTASTFYIVDACVFTASDEFLIIKLPYTHSFPSFPAHRDVRAITPSPLAYC